MKRYALIFALLFMSILGFDFKAADDLIALLEKKLFSYTQEHPVTQLYVHIDKNIYMPGEILWFKAYISSNSQFEDKALYVKLVDAANITVLQKEFRCYDIRSNGDITLPDTLKTGTYQLYAYTDMMMNFSAGDVFVQQLKIVANAGSELKVSASVADSSSLQPGKNVEVLCDLMSSGRPATNEKGSYSLSADRGRIITQGKINTNELGHATISFVYPDIDSLQHLKLLVRFSRKKEVEELFLNLPPRRRKIVLQAYPEGGSLVNGIPSKLLIVTKDQYGQSLSAQVSLLSNNSKIAECTTNGRGYGVLLVTPGQLKNYRFILNKGKQEQLSGFNLPVKAAGWSVSMRNPDGIPAVLIRNMNMQENAALVVRSMHEIVWYKSLSVKSGDSLLVPLPFADSSRRLLSLALFDRAGTLFNERLFRSGKKENYHLTYTLSKSKYGRRERVNVKLKVTDALGKPVMANLSVAAVTNKALDEVNYKNILQTEYQLLGKPDQQYIRYDGQDKDFNDVLIAEHWLHNAWADILAYPAKGTVRLIANPSGVMGYVKSKRNKPLKVQNLFLFNISGPKPFPVQPDGLFSIPMEALLTENGKQNYIIVNDDFSNNYRLEIKDYTLEFDKKVHESGILSKPLEFLTASRPATPAPFVGGTLLKEVKITGSPEIARFAQLKLAYPADCSDYVCLYNYLNCSTHLWGTKPEIGKSYNLNGILTVYTHCLNSQPRENNNFLIKNITEPREFPLADYQLDNTSTFDFLSTLYWNPNINTDKTGEATFQFYTSDLKGTFKLIAQGLEVHSARFIYGKTEFRVE